MGLGNLLQPQGRGGATVYEATSPSSPGGAEDGGIVLAEAQTPGMVEEAGGGGRRAVPQERTRARRPEPRAEAEVAGGGGRERRGRRESVRRRAWQAIRLYVRRRHAGSAAEALRATAQAYVQQVKLKRLDERYGNTVDPFRRKAIQEEYSRLLNAPAAPAQVAALLRHRDLVPRGEGTAYKRKTPAPGRILKMGETPVWSLRATQFRVLASKPAPKVERGNTFARATNMRELLEHKADLTKRNEVISVFYNKTGHLPQESWVQQELDTARFALELRGVQ